MFGTADVTKVTISWSGGEVSGGIDMLPVAPKVFTIASTGVPAAVIVRVRDGVPSVEQAFQANAAGGYEPLPIDLGPETDQLFLVVFGTGWRHHRSQSDPRSYNAHLIFQDRPGAETIAVVMVDYAGLQGEFAGLDQANMRLPRSLAGHGQVFAYLSIDDNWTGPFAQLSFK
jgi:uncharacterized protein (TIGR03437 family)